MSYAAQELTASPPGASLLRRLRTLFKAIVSRIDLSDFPKSCCG
ncbi:MAG: hypothetical protein WA418_03725 [Bradyrhizobium sp.]